MAQHRLVFLNPTFPRLAKTASGSRILPSRFISLHRHLSGASFYLSGRPSPLDLPLSAPPLSDSPFTYLFIWLISAVFVLLHFSFLRSASLLDRTPPPSPPQVFFSVLCWSKVNDQKCPFSPSSLLSLDLFQRSFRSALQDPSGDRSENCFLSAPPSYIFLP